MNDYRPPRSLGMRSELIFVNFDGVVEDRGEFLVVRTPENPTYFWGNFIYMGRPPRAGDMASWRELFRSEFTDPRIYHETFGWDSPEGEEGEIAQFEQAGFEADRAVVLTANALNPPPHLCSGAVLRPLETDQDWKAQIDLLMTSRLSDDDKGISDERWLAFHATQSTRYRKMTVQNRGHWWGAFVDGRLACSLGVFHDGHGTGRYQVVTTDPAYRRRGLCGSLVHAAGSDALARWKLKNLVMLADPAYHAARIYESVGFRPTEKMIGVSRHEKDRSIS
jgi:hypothetical protein